MLLMKHSELRRGNWVICNENSVGQITHIHLQTEPAGAWPIVAIGCIHYYPFDLKPVCITEKWLNKLGFTIKERWPSQSGDYFFRPDRKVKIGISTRYGNTISLNNEDDPDIYLISYVHELQNLYKDMTGETI